MYETIEARINGKKKLVTALATMRSLYGNVYDNWTGDWTTHKSLFDSRSFKRLARVRCVETDSGAHPDICSMGNRRAVR